MTSSHTGLESRSRCTLATVLLMVAATPLLGAVPTALWLPEGAKLHLSVAEFQQSKSLFDKTGVGRCLKDPALEPFWQDLPRQLRQQARAGLFGLLWVDLGVDWARFAEIPRGEVAWGVIAWKERPVALLMADVTGQKEQVDQLRREIDEAMAKKGISKQEQQLEGTTLSIYSLPQQANTPRQTLVCFVRKDFFVATENLEFAQSILGQVGVERKDSLATNEAYQKVMLDCRKVFTDRPTASLYMVPLDLVELLHQVAQEHEADAGPSSDVLRNQGFGAVKATGALINIGAGASDFRFVASIYAPQPWVKSMQMVDLRNDRFSPAPWVFADSASCNVMNIHAASVYKNLSSFFDEIVANGAEGTWNDVLESLRDEPDGPRLDLNTEIFEFLAGPAIVLESESLPVTPDSPRVLLAIRSTDEKALAAGIKKAMQDDPVIENRTIGETTVYYSMSRERKDVPLWIMAVANGHLFMTTDFSILTPVLERTAAEPLADDAMFRLSVEPLMKGTFADVSATVFYRLDRWLQVRYELLRAGKSRSANRSLTGMINSFLGGEPLDEQKPTVDGSKLPPFEQVRKHFGILAAAVKTTDTGWIVTGHVLPMSGQ